MKATSIVLEKAVEGSHQMRTTAANVTAQKRADEAPGPSRGQLENRMAGRTTELDQAHEALSDAQRVMEVMLDNIPDRIYLKDTQGRFIQCNRAVAQRVGVEDPKQVVGKTDYDFYSREKADELHQDEQRIIRTGEPLLNKIESMTRPGGEIIWSSVTKVPLRDKAGNVVGLVGISRNITEQKRAEETLRQSHDELEKHVAARTAELTRERLLLRTLIDNLPDCIYAKDTTGRKTMANPADLKIVGRKTEAEAVGKNDFDLFPKVIAEKFWADDQKVIQGKPVINREEYFLDEKGRKRWLLTSKLPMRDQQGTIIGLVGIGRDITDKKRAEEALSQERRLLRTLIDNLPDGIYAKDITGRKTLANPADLKLLGCKTEAEAIGKSDFDYFPKEIAEKFWADDLKVIHGEPVINREEYCRDGEGRKRWLLTSKLPLRDQRQAIVGLIGIGRDITAIKEAEAKVDQIHKQLLETSHRAGMAEVATSVLHNVGNVLNSVNVASTCVADVVRGSKVANLSKIAALLREHADNLGDFVTNDPKGKQLPGYLAQLAGHLVGEQTAALEKLDRLRKNIEHVKDIVAMQQNYAKASGVLESLPVVDLVEDAFRMQVGSMERHQIKVLREYAETPQILVDKHKVLQILVNLISNAKHACDDSGKPDKQITLRVANGDGRIKISVTDNGVGIPAENLTRIFNHGFTTRKNGHGFGLHSGALDAKELGGSLAVFSEGPGRGANFTLELPVKHSRKSS